LATFRIQDLSISYFKKNILSNISFAIQSPAFIAIVGHNGSGKTSFFKSITQSISYRGKIFVDDQLIKKQNHPSIVLLHQQNNLAFDVSVQDLIVMGSYRDKNFFDRYTETDYRQVQQIAKKLHIDQFLSKNMNTLSGGEQQIVWLAQAMMQQANVYLLDEPTQYLDLYNKRKVFDVMQELAYENNKIVFCITHDLANLKGREGYLLNFSSESIQLESISSEVLERSIEKLETKME